MKEYRYNTGFRALTNAALLDGMGNALYNIVFIVYASTLSFRVLAVSLASVATFIPSLLQAYTGFLADQTQNKTRWLLWSRLLQGGLFVLLAICIALPESIPLFLGLLLINIGSDCLGQYGSGLQLPFVSRMVTTEHLEGAIGFQTASGTFFQIIFQGIGAWAIVVLHHDFSLFGLINAFTFVLAAGVLFWHRQTFITVARASQTPPAKAHTFVTSFKTTLALMHRQSLLFVIILFAIGVNTLGTGIDGLVNLSLLNQSQLFIGNYGNTVAIINMVTAGGLVLGSLWTSDWFKHVDFFPIIALMMLLLVGISLCFVFKTGIVLIIGFFFGVGYLIGKVNPRLSALMMRTIPENQLAQAAGVIGTIVMLGGPIGSSVFLFIANLFTPVLSWLIFLVVAFMIGFAALITYKRVVVGHIH